MFNVPYYGICINCGFDGRVFPTPLIGTQFHPELQNEVLLCRDCHRDWYLAWDQIVYPTLVTVEALHLND